VVVSVRPENSFVRALDLRDAAGIGALFAEDGALVSAGRRYQGREAVQSYYEQRFSAVGSAHHVMTEVERIAGDDFDESAWTWIAVLGPSESPLLSCGRYRFRLDRDDRVAQLEVQVDATYGLGPATALAALPPTES